MEPIVGYPKPQAANEAETAIRHMKSRAGPILSRMMTRTESSGRIKLVNAMPKSWITRLGIKNENDYKHGISETRRLGAYGFVALGPDAGSAIPSLIELLHNKHDDVRYVSVFALRCLGPFASNALPSLIICLNDPELMVRDDAVMSLGTIHQEANRVIPILMKFLEKYRDDRILSRDAIDSLAAFDGDAKPAIPVLLRFLFLFLLFLSSVGLSWRAFGNADTNEILFKRL